jgi:hypothetical protein
MSSRHLRTSPLLRNISAHPLALIDRILRSAELTAEQLADAERSYRAVTEVLAKAGMPVQPYSPFMFAQGSMRIGTTVRPLGQDEHDLDVVCMLRVGGVWLSANEVYRLVWDTLGNDGTYREMRQRKNRCIRLSYARKFHLDITPAVPERTQQDGPLFVPDRELSVWCPSHPVGFADWFSAGAKALPIFQRSFSAIDEEMVVTASAAQIEPLPEHGFEKTPLQRITQLLKRDRDEFFQSDLKRRPSSILLTTLAAHSYAAEVRNPAPDLFEFVTRVAARLHEFIRLQDILPGRQSYWVENPVNRKENFAEKWSLADHEAFSHWQGTLVKKLRAVSTTKGKGLDVMLESLSAGFGKEGVLKAATTLGLDTSSVHQAGRLRVSGATGVIGLAGSAMGATVYHGQ